MSLLHYDPKSGLPPQFVNESTLRDQFACHAPQPPPDWFVPDVGPRPKDDWRCRHKPDWRYDSYEAADADGLPWNAAELPIEVYEEHVKRQKGIQWPYAWADLMLAEKKKTVHDKPINDPVRLTSHLL